MSRRDRAWSWFRRRALIIQVLGWLLCWGPLAALWLSRRPGFHWKLLAVVPFMIWLGSYGDLVSPRTPPPTATQVAFQSTAPALPSPTATLKPSPTPIPTPTPTAVPTPTATPVGFTLAQAHRSVAVEHWGQVNDTTYGFFVKVCALPDATRVSVLPTDFELVLSDQTRAQPDLFSFLSGLSPVLSAETLLPGDCVRGWLVYTVHAGVKPVELRYQPLDQLGGPLARWQLVG